MYIQKNGAGFVYAFFAVLILCLKHETKYRKESCTPELLQKRKKERERERAYIF